MLAFLKFMLQPPKPAQPAAKPVPPPVAKAPPRTLQRAELIREAMEVHRAKRKILDDLSDDSRAKLVAMAVLAMLNQGQKPAPQENTGRKPPAKAK